MSFFPPRGASNYRMDSRSNNSSRFSGYSSTRSDKSFDEEVNGTAKRKKRNNKKPAQNSRPGFSPVGFKEPNMPPNISQLTRNPRPNPFYQSSSRPRPVFDMNEMPDFVEKQHRSSDWDWQSFFRRSKLWQDKHKLAYYRSRCLALEFENKMLFEQITTLIDENHVLASERGEMPTIQLPHIPAFDGPLPKSPRPNPGAQATDSPGQQPNNPKPSQGAKATKNEVPQKSQGKKNKEAPSNKHPNTDRLEFEISEEMMSFLETSMRHKLNLKLKKQDAYSEEMEEDMNTIQDKNVKREGPKVSHGFKRKEELDTLYGSSSALIQGLETSIQHQFNRNCDLFKPEVWMAVPLNPETVSS